MREWSQVGAREGGQEAEGRGTVLEGPRVGMEAWPAELAEAGLEPLHLWLGRPGHAYVKHIVPDSPAAKSGLIREGDRLVALRCMQGDLIPTKNWPLRNLVELLVGEAGEAIELVLQRPWAPEAAEREAHKRKRMIQYALEAREARHGLRAASGADEAAETSLERLLDLAEGKMETVRVCLIRHARRSYLPPATAAGEPNRLLTEPSLGGVPAVERVMQGTSAVPPLLWAAARAQLQAEIQALASLDAPPALLHPLPTPLVDAWRGAGGEEEDVWEELERQGEEEDADGGAEEDGVSEQERAEAPELAAMHAWQARQQVPL